MKITSILIVLFALTGAGCSGDRPEESNAQHSAASVQEDYYTCPMHPSVRSDRPGACPVCGMALVKKAALTEASDSEVAALERVSLSPTQRILANVSTTVATRRELVKEVPAAGIVSFAEPKRALVAARFRGRIERVFVDYAGLAVREGEKLFELYSPDLVSAEQDLLLALHSQLDNGERLPLLEASRERLKTHFGMTREQIASIEKEGKPRSTMIFTAPRSGTVLSKQVVEGQYIEEGTTLYEIADLSTVWINFDVYEQDLRFIQQGQTASFSTDSFPGEEFSGRVTFIDPVMNPDTRTVRVRTEAANPSGKLRPQMFVSGSFSVRVPASIAVPRSAVLSTGKRNVVWVEKEPNVFEPRLVRAGAATDRWIQVLDGLREGESVVTTGGYLIDSESTLQTPSAAPSSHTEHSPKSSASGPMPSDAVQDFTIHVQGRYSPDVIKARLGSPIRLRFHREEESACTKEIVFKDFNIKRELPAWKTTTIELHPGKPGTYRFTCGMDMVHGTLIVE